MDIVGISEKEQVSLCKQLLNVNFVFCRFILTVSFSLCLYQQEAIFRVVAAILHIGNIEFTKGKEVDSSVPKDDKAKFHLKTAAELLMFVKHFASVCCHVLSIVRADWKSRL